MNRSLLLTCVLACGGSEPPRETVVTLPAAPPSPVATLSIALPQTELASSSGWSPPRPKNPPDVTEARRHFADGVRAYDAGDYARALTEFETAYSYSPRDPLLYNIGAALERLRRRGDAIAAYERYAQTVAEPSRKAEIQAKIDGLRRRP